jgi:hypothetical protein
VDVCVEVEDYCKCEVPTYMSDDVPPKTSLTYPNCLKVCTLMFLNKTFWRKIHAFWL